MIRWPSTNILWFYWLIVENQLVAQEFTTISYYCSICILSSKAINRYTGCSGLKGTWSERNQLYYISYIIYYLLIYTALKVKILSIINIFCQLIITYQSYEIIATIFIRISNQFMNINTQNNWGFEKRSWTSFIILAAVVVGGSSFFHFCYGPQYMVLPKVSGFHKYKHLAISSGVTCLFY